MAFASTSRACLQCLTSASRTQTTMRLSPASSAAFLSTSAKLSEGVKMTGEEGARAMRAIVGDGRVAPDSQVGILQARQELSSTGRQQAPLYDGKSIRPGDLHHTRMFPTRGQFTRRTTLTTTSLGPSKARSKQTDFFIRHGDMNPLNETLNVPLLSKYVTNMGKIMNRAQTQLTWKTQRRVGKAIRRARAMGLMPYFADWSESRDREAKARQLGITNTNPVR